MTKTAILLDFDNVFFGLWRVDPDLAVRFADSPLDWLSLLAGRHLTLETRRWLVARCYLNPAGWVDAPGESSGRLYFSRFRPAFVRAGFNVIDCPALTRESKNAADIHIVIDALDLLAASCRIDEFVIGSGDADFAPLVHRLRANDRRTTIISARSAAIAYASLADRIIDFGALDALVRPERTETTGSITSDDAIDGENGEAALQAYLRERLASSLNPLNLSTLAHEALRVMPGVRATKYFGAGSFVSAVKRLGLSSLRVSQHFVWDEDRHQPPTEVASSDAGIPARAPGAGVLS
jgi:hypothetical protein